MDHREEKTFTINVRLSATFDEGYEGDMDGLVWIERFDRVIRPRLIKAVFQALRSEPSFEAIAGNRGQSPADALEVNVRYVAAAESADKG